MAPRIELLWWKECPSWERAMEILREEMERAGLDAAGADVIEVTSEAEAERLGFPGSPTIRIDGRDLQPLGPDEPGGLTCRVYRSRNGRTSPLPDREDLRDALLEVSESE